MPAIKLLARESVVDISVFYFCLWSKILFEKLVARQATIIGHRTSGRAAYGGCRPVHATSGRVRSADSIADCPLLLVHT